MVVNRKVVWILDQQKSEYLDAQPLLATKSIDLLVLSGNLGADACRASSEKAIELFGTPSLVMVAEGFFECCQEIVTGLRTVPELWELKKPTELDQNPMVAGAQQVPLFKNATDLVSRLSRLEPRAPAARPKLERSKRKFTASHGGYTVHLTPREYEIIATLAESPDFARTRADIRSQIWKNIKVCNKVLDVHISNARKKMMKLGFKIQFQRPETYALIANDAGEAEGEPTMALRQPPMITLVKNVRSA